MSVLDTHILLWWFEDGHRLSALQRRVLEEASADNPLGVCNITLWEIATLHRLGRIALDRPLRDWLADATAPPLVQRHALSPRIAAEVTALPEDFPRDPADRMIAATARVRGEPLVTSDEAIIESGAVETIP